jgi:HNH endonuclease
MFALSNSIGVLIASDKRVLTPDHIVPVSKGGAGDISNIQPLCLHCNISKGNRLIVCFLPWRESCE